MASPTLLTPPAPETAPPSGSATAAAAERLSPAQRRRGLIAVALAVASIGVAMNIQLALNSNFVAQEMGLSGSGQGILESFRESCGLFALPLLATLGLLVAEPVVGACMLILLAIGLTAYSYVSQFWFLVGASFIWSQGLHVWMPLPQSMTLTLAEEGHAGRRLGQISVAGAIGAATGLVAVLILHAGLKVTIRPLYLVSGAAALVGAAAILAVPWRLKAPGGPRLIFRRRYGLYYLLQFLEGWRKQICIGFAGFLIVKKYHTPLTTLLCLWLAVQAIGWVLSPAVGRWIDRAGERRVLTFYYLSLTLLFAGYALIDNLYFLYAVFIIDNAFFAFTMALTSYVSRIAPKAEHTPTLSMGVAANHVAAVTMPLVGGLLWDRVDYRWVFLTGVVAAGLSLTVARRLPMKTAG